MTEIMPNDTSLENFRKRNKNKDFTLIARDCVGGILYHQLGLRFLSPTINLCMDSEDFNLLCLNLKVYMDGELEELVDETKDYPVGLLYPAKRSSLTHPLRLELMHYDNFEIAKQKWNDRKTRINWDNIHVVSSCCYITETEPLTNQVINDWNQIKYKKMIFVDKEYGFDGEFKIKKHPKCHDFAWLLYSPSKTYKWKRTFNKFNFIKFLNNKSNKNVIK